MCWRRRRAGKSLTATRSARRRCEAPATRFADHWTYLLRPMVRHHTGEPGIVRYRQIEFSRMPLCAYLAMDDARSLTRADFVRLGLVARPEESEALPFSPRYLKDFEERYCHDPYWNEEATGKPGTRYMTTAQVMTDCGAAYVAPN